MKLVVNNTEAEQRIKLLQPFRTASRTLRGEGGGEKEARPMGDLPEEHHADARSSRYVIYSYRTPIAWVTADGTKVLPDVGYSRTTSQHQYMVANAWKIPFYPKRGRTVVRAGGGPRRGGVDDL